MRGPRGGSECLRDCTGQVLFIDARNLGYMKNRVLRDFKPEDIEKIAGTFHVWRNEPLNPSHSPFVKGGSERTQDSLFNKGEIEEPQIPLFEKEGSCHKEGLGGIYQDITGFCKSATLDEIIRHDYVLTPGRYVGAAEEEDDGEPFVEKMKRLTSQLKE